MPTAEFVSRVRGIAGSRWRPLLMLKDLSADSSDDDGLCEGRQVVLWPLSVDDPNHVAEETHIGGTPTREVCLGSRQPGTDLASSR